MKKKLSLFLSAILILSLTAACGRTESTAAVSSADQSSSAPVASTAPSTPAPEAAEEASDVQESSGEAAVEEALPEFELPIVETPESLSLWMNLEPFMMAYSVDPNNFTFFTEMESRTGVHLDITAVVPFTASEDFNLMIASGDMTDMIGRFANYYTEGYDAAIDNGILIDLSDYLETTMHYYNQALNSDPEFHRDSLTADGRIGAANCLYVSQEGVTGGPVIRQDWLDQVGLELPETYEDYENILLAFQSELGRGGAYLVGPYGINTGNYLAAGFETMGFYEDSENSQPFLVKDGVVEFGPSTEGYRDYLALLSSWYQEGILNTDFMSLDTRSSMSLVSQDEVGIFCTTTSNAITAASSALNPDYKLTAISDAKQTADQVLHIRQTTDQVVDGYSITTSCENVETAAKWLDYCYTDDGYLLANYGVENVSFEYDADGNPHYTEVVTNNADYPVIVAASLYSQYAGPMCCDGARYLTTYTDEERAMLEKWSETDSDYVFPYRAALSAEESDQFHSYYGEIKTYVTEMTLKFIIGEASLDDWDTYTANLNSMGLDDMVSIKQIAYDRYIAR